MVDFNYTRWCKAQVLRCDYSFMFIRSHLSSSLQRQVASSAVRMFLLAYTFATVTLTSSMKKIITYNSMRLSPTHPLPKEREVIKKK